MANMRKNLVVKILRQKLNWLGRGQGSGQSMSGGVVCKNSSIIDVLPDVQC